MLVTPVLKTLAEDIGARQTRKESSIADLVERANSEKMGSWLAERAMVKFFDDKEKARSALTEIHAKLKQNRLKKKIAQLEQQIHLANSEGDDMRVLELSREKATLQKEGTTNLDTLFDAKTAKA